jgi:hypothetical protein
MTESSGKTVYYYEVPVFMGELDPPFCEMQRRYGKIKKVTIFGKMCAQNDVVTGTYACL